jgi:hypothetical protein
MTELKFKVGDKVLYIGDNKKYVGLSGIITHTKEDRKVEIDILTGETLYPKDDFDYTIKCAQDGRISFAFDVQEVEITLMT